MKAPRTPWTWFAALCLFWGTNWLILKLAVDSVPPFAFAAARSTLAGLLMIAIAGPRQALALVRAEPLPLLVTALLTNTLAYAGMYWGTARISTGVAAIVNNATMPIGLFAFGLALREEAFSWRRLAGIVLGAFGLSLLFFDRGGASFGQASAAGVAAMAAGTLAWCLGSVGSRGMLRRTSPMALGGTQMLIGGLALVPVALAFEAPAADLAAGFARPLPLAALVWLAVVGGVFGLTLYLRLLRDWGPSRAGMYAFVSPIIATALGALVLGERLGTLEAVGGGLMLAAAGLVLPGSRAPSATPPAATASR